MEVRTVSMSPVWSRVFGFGLLLAAAAVGARYVPLKQWLATASVPPAVSAPLLLGAIALLALSGFAALRTRGDARAPAA